jgi:hypothetical protein
LHEVQRALATGLPQDALTSTVDSQLRGPWLGPLPLSPLLRTSSSAGQGGAPGPASPPCSPRQSFTGSLNGSSAASSSDDLSSLGKDGALTAIEICYAMLQTAYLVNHSMILTLFAYITVVHPHCIALCIMNTVVSIASNLFIILLLPAV